MFNVLPLVSSSADAPVAWSFYHPPPRYLAEPSIPLAAHLPDQVDLRCDPAEPCYACILSNRPSARPAAPPGRTLNALTTRSPPGCSHSRELQRQLTQQCSEPGRGCNTTDIGRQVGEHKVSLAPPSAPRLPQRGVLAEIAWTKRTPPIGSIGGCPRQRFLAGPGRSRRSWHQPPAPRPDRPPSSRAKQASFSTSSASRRRPRR